MKTRLMIAVLLLCGTTFAQPAAERLADSPGVASKVQAVEAAAAALDNRTHALKRAIQSTPPAIIERADLVGPGRVRIYAAPIRYQDAEGFYRPIELAWTEDSTYTLACRENSMAVGIDSQGGLHHSGRDWALATRPHGASERIKVKRTDAGVIEVSGLWPSGAVTRYELQRGGVKESIVLERAPDSTTFAYDVRLSDTTRLELGEGGAECHILADGSAVAILPRPVAVDAKGARCRGTYTLDGAVLSTVFDAKWFSTAAYPVEVDPTTTENVDICRYGGPSYHDGEWAFLKFPLPELGTVTGCALTMTVNSNDLADTLTVHSYTSDDATWDTSTSGSALLAITTTASLDSNALSGSTSGTVVWDVFGDDEDAEAIAYAFANDADPCDWTVRLSWNDTGGGAVYTGTGIIEFWTSEGEEIAFDGPSGTTPPYLEFTYDAAPAVGARGSGSVGILGP